ncbi:hypothetical protein CMQ_2137 [Grosmannia clavigera kw1407]|uniref:Uncharacterized protein n=1 Tax=Grosmannia clavigera (strain kw1407 / UAMH 11150) TaxID=655863 RepID=F0XJE3_GROCL|nr:uncharacterized protein CMQ_2137 [Grosmannia clavigera kw1407]EFX02088.1 hypothetical protein CMQ_2137 [Grosmannia clavigera kw1407]
MAYLKSAALRRFPPGPVQDQEAPPPYHPEPEASNCTNTTRNTECEVRLRSGDVGLADIIAEKSGGPATAIAKVIYTAAYAVSSDLVAETVTNISECIQATLEAIDDLSQEDRDTVAPAMVISITNAVKMVAALGQDTSSVE